MPDQIRLQPESSPHESPPAILSIGLTLGIIWIILFFALVKKEQSLSILCGSILILMHGAGVWSRVAHKNLFVEFNSESSRLFPGEKLTIAVSVRNLKILPVWIFLKLESTALFSVTDQECEISGLNGETLLPPFSKRFREIRLTAIHRGVWTDRSMHLTSGDIFGLQRRCKSSIIPGETIIYPRLGRLSHINIPFQEFFGIHASRGCIEDPSRYEGTRDYTGLRSSRYINWNASARLNKLQEKIFEPTTHRKVILLLDCSGLRIADEFEHLLSTAATFAAELMESGATFASITNASLINSSCPVLPFGRGPEHLGRFLTILARIGTENPQSKPVPQDLTWTSGTGCVYFGPEVKRLPEKTLPYSALKPGARKLAVFSNLDQESDEEKYSNAWKMKGFSLYRAGDIVHEE